MTAQIKKKSSKYLSTAINYVRDELFEILYSCSSLQGLQCVIFFVLIYSLVFEIQYFLMELKMKFLKDEIFNIIKSILLEILETF